ncbi:LacI family transcriptional regulator [Novosphingobium umbonatum]|uniref:LacI family transcriptional regulator n=1 Tax=Novosphingobium umbonatum TaxID=1908524 RepID=A0A3S2UV72_9SPHN|nr:LacI family DNA-binding transcriptional regulator [Novosphingobium umbonatum]RVU05899.1 LacI family transcriptional regulator [Novosphingobium umbonatum]
MATIKDVAEYSGISIKTVSRVINGAPTVRPKVRAKVEEAIRALNYRPALAARQLASGRSFIVAMIAPRQTYSYFSRLMVAMAEACRDYGHHLVLEVIDRSEMDSDPAWTLQLSCEPDAVIIVPPYADDPRMVEAVAALGKPMLRMAVGDDGVGQALPVPSYEISYAMGRYLLAKGHRQLAIIAPPRKTMSAYARVEGFAQALADAGVDLPPSCIVAGTMDFASGEAAFRQLMSLPRRPTAIFATNDPMALGAMACALRLGFSVPQDVAIAGFDNSVEGQMCYPPLTSVHQPLEEIARAAVGLVLGVEQQRPEFIHHIVERESA